MNVKTRELLCFRALDGNNVGLSPCPISLPPFCLRTERETGMAGNYGLQFTPVPLAKCTWSFLFYLQQFFCMQQKNLFGANFLFEAMFLFAAFFYFYLKQLLSQATQAMGIMINWENHICAIINSLT